jgi:hypothetical protein
MMMKSDQHGLDLLDRQEEAIKDQLGDQGPAGVPIGSIGATGPIGESGPTGQTGPTGGTPWTPTSFGIGITGYTGFGYT